MNEEDPNMPAPISIVIPTLNAAETLGDCLNALMEGLYQALICELIVVDGGSTDATGATAQAWGAEVIETAPSRGGQLRAGCAAAKGNWLLVIHADTVLEEGWSKAVIAHLETKQAGWFALQFDARGLAPAMVAGWANLRSRFGLPYGDQALLVPRALYHKVGGYPDQPLMEDVAIARALKGRLTALDGVAVTSAGKYRTQGWVKRGTRNLLTLIRYAFGASPEALAQQYRRKA